MTTNTNLQEDTMTAAITPANDDDNTPDVVAEIDALEADLDDEGPAPVAARAIGKTKKAPAKNAIPAGRLSTREVAEELDVAPSRLRVFLRSQGDRYTPPGSGGRYSFTKTDVKSIKTAFAKWEKELAAEKKAK